MGIVALSAVAAQPAPSPSAASSPNMQVAEMSYFLPQVRLRKLHLVRPDLIRYPIDVEVVC